MNIDIQDRLYERIAKVAAAWPYPTTVEQQIEKAIVVRLAFWERFFFDNPAAAQEANFPKGDTT